MIAVTPKEWEWASLSDMEGPEEDRTVWLMKDLSEDARVRLEDSVMIVRDHETGAQSTGFGTRVMLTLLGGLRGIKEGSPFNDEDGKPIKFELSSDFLQHIPWPVQVEMYLAISGRMTMTVEEKEE